MVSRKNTSFRYAEIHLNAAILLSDDERKAIDVLEELEPTEYVGWRQRGGLSAATARFAYSSTSRG